MNYTREQSLALCTDRYISVTANAGSGKTKVLVDRYFDILLNGDNDLPIDSREVVAITFTKKAASEMLAKVVKRIESEIKIATDSKKLRKLKKIRENLIYARISTIHSFASSLLRDYPIEAGVLPSFSELTKADEIRLYDNAINEVIEMRFEIPEKKEEIFQLYETLSRYKVDEIIRLCLKQAENLDAIQEFYNKTDDEIFDFYTSQIYDLYCQRVRIIVENFYEVAKDADLSHFNKKKDADTYEEIFLQLENIKRMSTDTIEECRVVFEKFSELVKLKIGASLFVTKAYSYSLSDLNYPKKQYTDDIKKLIEYDELFYCENELRQSIRTSKIILDLVIEIYELCNEKKLEAGYLDFNDMILKVDKLLDNETALAQIKQKMKYILVDEFQDTNPLQYRLIKKLCPKLVNPILNDDINLFIVGDSKQSIYAFRSADVRVFKEATNNIETVNSYSIENKIIESQIKYDNEVIESNKAEENGIITLSASFRLSPVVATFVNLVCGNIMNKYSNFTESAIYVLPDFEVPYSPLVYARNSEDFVQKYDNLESKLLNNEFGSVSFLFNIIDKNTKNDDDSEKRTESENNDDTEEETILNEGEMIARLISDMVSENEEYSVIENNTRRLAKYGDIAILARSKNGFKNITNSFIKYNIPYTLHSGSGFYEAQEVVDVINYLKFIQNNHDDIALAGLLKSVFFGLNDTQLFKISLTEGNSFWDKFNNFVGKIENDTDEFDVMINAHQILTQILEIALRVPLVHLLYKILNSSNWYGAIQKSNSAEQMNANIRKLIAFARTYEDKGFKNIYDFILDLEVLSEDKGEAEAAFITGENVVNIMTIHAAKGLEFPIVILANTNSKGHSGDSYFINAEFGINFKYPILNDKQNPEFSALHNFKLASYFQELSENAEEKRILYVAMTRAKEHLVISSTIKKGNNGWNAALKQFKMISEGMKFNMEVFEEPEFIDKKHYSGMLEVLINNEQLKYQFEYPIKFMNYKNYSIQVSSSVEKKLEIPEVLDVVIKPGIYESNISATKLLYYINDKDAYIQRYVLGLPPDDILKSHTENVLIDEQSNGNENTEILFSKDEDAKGFIAGNYIHSLLERISIWFDDDIEIIKTNLKNEISNLTIKFNKKFGNELENRLFNESLYICQTKLISRFKSQLKESKPEITYHIPFEYDLISATFDLFIQNESNEWEIWDWKSNQINNDEDLIELGKHYEIQMKLYSYFNYLLNPNQSDYKARLLFTRRAKIDCLDENWTILFKWDKNEMENFREYLSNLLLEIKKFG